MNSSFGALVVSSILGFAYHFWFMSLVTKYYSLNALFVSALIYMAVLNYKSPEIKYIYLFSLITGLGFANHQTQILFLPSLILLMVMTKNPELLTTKKTAIYLSLFLTGLAVYFYIYIRACQKPILAWEDPRTFERFWGIISRSRYGALSLAQGYSSSFKLPLIKTQLVYFCQMLVKSAGLLNVILLILSIILLFLKKLKLAIIFVSMFLIAGPGFIIFTRSELTESVKDLLERYVYLGIIPVPLIIGAAIAGSGIPKKIKLVIYTALLINSIFLFQKNYLISTHRYDFVYPDMARNILKTLPRNSILFSDRADEMEFTLAYLTKAVKLRQDISFIDCNASVSRSIYGDNYYKIWGKPRLEIRERVEREIIVNTNRPVYYATFEPKMINIPRYPEGMIFNTKPQPDRQAFPWDEIYVLRENNNMDFRSRGLFSSYAGLLGKYFIQAVKSGTGISRAQKTFQLMKTYNTGAPAEQIIAYMYLEKGLYPLAEAEYLSLINRGISGPETYTNLGVIYEKQGKLEKSIEIYKKSISKYPDNAQAHYNLGVVYWHKSEWNKVITEFEAVLKLQPDNKIVRQYLDSLYSKKR